MDAPVPSRGETAPSRMQELRERGPTVVPGRWTAWFLVTVGIVGVAGQLLGGDPDIVPTALFGALIAAPAAVKAEDR
jgi:hypothetical protein